GNRLARNSSNDFRFSSLQYCPARTSHRYLPSSANRVSRSASFCFSHARISSILVRTNSARLRLSFGGIGIGLKRKFVKQTKVNSGLAHQCSFDQVTLIEAEPDEGAGGTRILWKADAAVRQEQPGLDPSDRVFDQGCELLPLLVRNGSPEVLDFNQSLADENNFGNFVDSGHPRIADELRVQRGNAGRLLRISCGRGLPFQNAGRAVQFTNGVDVSDKTVAGSQGPIELNLLGGTRVANANPAVLSETFEQLDALLQHTVPGVAARVGQAHVLAHAPLLEQHSRRVFMAKEGGDGLFERSAKEHGGARVFLLPTVEVAVPVTARTAKVLADLGVGVVHRETSAVLERKELDTGAADSSSHWLAGAKPSRLMSEMPLITVWLILTTPRSPGKAFSSTCSWARSSGS